MVSSFAPNLGYGEPRKQTGPRRSDELRGGHDLNGQVLPMLAVPSDANHGVNGAAS